MPLLSLQQLGWRNALQQQLGSADTGDLQPVRIIGVERSGWLVIGEGGETTLDPALAASDIGAVTVGDWLLVDADSRARRCLERASLFKRRAPGTNRREQLIAANIDTVFIVSSCNQDFNEARLERYLAIAHEAGVMPVVVLTKADTSEDPGSYVAMAARLSPGVVTEAVNALERGSLACLDAWLGEGQTIALLGSSGVGKSTITNTLMDDDLIATRDIREDDARGRHTTTSRHMYRLPAGAWLIDSPGMREIQLVDVAGGIDDVFAEVSALAEQCRFGDCLHESEPGCAVRAAVKAGDITDARLARWRKLVREEALNRESIAERRARGKALGRLYKDTLGASHARKGRT
jgi:ribosome biogenesis GTPase